MGYFFRKAWGGGEGEAVDFADVRPLGWSHGGAEEGEVGGVGGGGGGGLAGQE